MDKQDKILKILQEANKQADALTATQAKQLVDLLVSLTTKQVNELVNKNEDFLSSVTQETFKQIQEALLVIKEKANDNQLEVRQLTNKQKDAHNARMSELEGLIEEFRNFEIPEPEEVDTEAIINETLARIPKVELPKEIEGEDIVDKINSLNTEPENQIDFSHIKNAPEFKGGRGGSTARNLYQLGDVNITEPTDTQILTYDSSNNTWKNADATGGSGAVDSVNSQTGVVVLDTDDISDTATSRYTNDTDITRLANTSGTNTGDQDLSSYAKLTDTAQDITANSFITDGGTSSQFVKGDGSLDNSTYITGNQTITLSGDVTGSGTTGITTTIAAGAVDIAMLSATGTPDSTTYLRGDNTWATIAGGGDVSKVGTPVDNQIGVWTGDGTIEGTSGFTYNGSNLLLTGDIGATGTRITKGWFTDLQVTNAIAGSITGNAGTVTNATLTTALTVNTGTLTLTANAANTSVLTIGAGAVSVSGTNTGDQTTITGNAGTATALQTARTIGGVSFDGTANITVASATGGFTVSGGALALGSQNITSTGSIGATGAGKLTKVWTVDLESTNMPTVGGTSLSSTFSPIAGSASITTVGTIGTGTWQGTAIGDTYISSAATWNAKQSAITFGTGVQTALGVNIGSAGAPILFNGAGGTPSSMVGTNITGTASGLTAGAVTGFTAGAGTLTGPASSGVAVTLGNNETITGVKTMSGLNVIQHSSSGLTVRNPANTFTYTITGAAIAANRQLNLPLITGTATLAVLSLAQTYTATQTFTSPATTTSITTGSTSFTAWAGATTLLTIGGTGASASLFAPSTLDTSSSTTGAIRTSGGISAAKALNIGTTITAGSTINATTGYKVAGGAASRKVLVGDGTNFVASTETYAAPGTSGNVMTSDGTNWTSAAPAGASVPAWVEEGSVSWSATSATQSITLTNTGKNYYKLIIATGAISGYVGIQFNNDTGAHYQYRKISDTAVAQSTAQTIMRIGSGNAGPVIIEANFGDVSSSKVAASFVVSNPDNATDYVSLTGMWNSASTVTSVQIVLGASCTGKAKLYSLNL